MVFRIEVLHIFWWIYSQTFDFNAIINGTVINISFKSIFLLIHRNTIGFCTLAFYPGILLNLLINSNSLSVESSGFLLLLLFLLPRPCHLIMAGNGLRVDYFIQSGFELIRSSVSVICESWFISIVLNPRVEAFRGPNKTWGVS